MVRAELRGQGLSRNPEPSMAEHLHNVVLNASLDMFVILLSTDGP
jgi:hypothetical protein